MLLYRLKFPEVPSWVSNANINHLKTQNLKQQLNFLAVICIYTPVGKFLAYKIKKKTHDKKGVSHLVL